MKVTTQDLGNREVELTIEVDDDRVERAMRVVARRYAREINIPGFRRGRAPYPIVAQRVGPDRLLQDALEEIGADIYQEALAEAGIEALYEMEPQEIASYDPLTLAAKVSLAPTVELGDYHSVQIDATPVEVSGEEIDEVLHEYQEENAQLVPVDRPSEWDDQVIVDLKVEVDDEPIYDRESISFVLAPGALTGLPEGFFQQLVGMEPGEEQEFTLTYPEDYDDEDLAGKTAAFTVVLHDVKERELPELDDELAQVVGGFESLEELRQRARETLESRAQVEADNELAETVLERVVEMATVEYPPAALEHEIEELLADLEARLQEQGLTLDNYMLMQGVTSEELREQQRENAEIRLKRSLVMSEIVEREGIEVSDAEIDEEIEAIAGMYAGQAGLARASLSSDESRRSIRSRLLAQKAIDRLIDIAAGEVDENEPEPSGELNAPVEDIGDESEIVTVEDDD